MDSGSLEISSDACLLAKGLKGLQLPSSPSSPLSPTPLLPSSSLSTASSSSSEDLLAAAGPVDYLDNFLQEALNSRNRITVLRLEQEIEKFAGNPKQQQLLLKPILSSYDRLAAHRVAHHYHLQSMAVESNGSSGSRILLLKTPDSKMPSIRLVDIPVDLTLNEKSTSLPLEKVAIKQRMSGAFNVNDSASAGMIAPLKSVEERTEEYNKARARIFNNGGPANRKDSRAGAEDQHIMGELPVSREVMSIGAERDRNEDDAAFRAANKVAAVFRDREKDIKDPDYDRSYGRYSPPLKTGIVTNVKPLVMMHGVCRASSGAICQGGIGNLQMRVDSLFYPASADNLNGPWVGLTGVPVLGYPCAMPGMQGHSMSNMYPLPTQKLLHPGYHSYANWRMPHSMPSSHVTMEWSRSY